MINWHGSLVGDGNTFSAWGRKCFLFSSHMFHLFLQDQLQSAFYMECLQHCHVCMGNMHTVVAWQQQLFKHPTFPQTLLNQVHNTTGTHFILFEIALDPLWPFTVPEKYICSRACL